jgi:hypothetical protein
MNRIVAHFQDGRLLKGFTSDFLPAKDRFHMSVEKEAPTTKPVEIQVRELKALFFVRTFEGNPKNRSRSEAAAGRAGAGRAIRVVFKDGEIMVGSTQGYDKSRPGFWLVPSDPASNNERCFVVAAAAQQVALL